MKKKYTLYLDIEQILKINYMISRSIVSVEYSIREDNKLRQMLTNDDKDQYEELTGIIAGSREYVESLVCLRGQLEESLTRSA